MSDIEIIAGYTKSKLIEIAKEVNNSTVKRGWRGNSALYGSVLAYGNIYKILGHECEVTAREDEEGYTRISELKIDGNIIEI